MADNDYIIQFKINNALIQMENTIEFLQAHINCPASKETQRMLAFLHNMLGCYHKRTNDICKLLTTED